MESKPIITIQDMVHKKPILKKTQCLKWLSPIVDKNAEITIRIVDNDESQNLNNIYRKKKYPTNVLSFLVDDEVRLIGDIVLCPVFAEKNGKQSLEKELELLTVHGVLHLLGYDHQEILDEEVMFKLQEDFLNQWRMKV